MTCYINIVLYLSVIFFIFFTSPVYSEPWQPLPGTSWQWQLDDPINNDILDVDVSFDVDMYDIDLFDTPESTIDALHNAGKKVICYFSAGSYEEWRSDAGTFPKDILGNPLDNWEGERWLDIRKDTVKDIMAKRLDLAVKKHCDGVEPDNIDGYVNDSGLPLTFQDQLDYNRWLAQAAHQKNLSIGLKNDLAQVKQLVNDFDWALNEQCFQFRECDLLEPFISAGKAVFGVEYKGNPDEFCPDANARNFSWLKKNNNLFAPVLTDCLKYKKNVVTPRYRSVIPVFSMLLDNDNAPAVSGEELSTFSGNVSRKDNR